AGDGGGGGQGRVREVLPPRAQPVDEGHRARSGGRQGIRRGARGTYLGRGLGSRWRELHVHVAARGRGGAQEPALVSGARILVADDEPEILRALRANLGRRGYDVAVAEDGAGALRAFAEHR